MPFRALSCTVILFVLIARPTLGEPTLFEDLQPQTEDLMIWNVSPDGLIVPARFADRAVYRSEAGD